MKVKKISTQQTRRTSREAIDSQQEPQLMILNETNSTDNRKTRNKHKKRTYSVVVKGVTNKNTNEKVISFQEIKANLVRHDVSQSYVTSPTVLNCDTFVCNNSSDQTEFVKESPDVISSQDDELLRILEDLQNESHVNDNSVSSDELRIRGYFCSDTIFNLSNRVLFEDKIKVLEKELDFAPIQRKVNEPELRQDFEEFCRQMRIKWHFRNEPSDNFNEIPTFRPESPWKPPTGHPNLEVFLSSVEQELFKDIEIPLKYSNLSNEEWGAIRSLADDRSIVIKKVDQGSALAV